MERQSTDRILMIRPTSFGYNPETAETNGFQSPAADASKEAVAAKAREEFDRAVEVIRSHDIDVKVFEDATGKANNDAVFPNNWLSLHQGKYIITYPMQPVSRRKERRQDIIDYLEKERGYEKRYAFEYMEEDKQFLEGTGSMVLDRENQVVYASLSPRTDIRALDRFAVVMGYKKEVFHSELNGQAIYHTNVMMSIADKYAVVCFEVISDMGERNTVKSSLVNSGKDLIEITKDQVLNFCGNVLQLRSRMGVPYLVMSKTAYTAFDIDQLDHILKFNKIIRVDVPTIERYGGGSIRCMIAEMH